MSSSRKRKLETPPLTDFQVVVAIPRPQLGDALSDERKKHVDQNDPLQEIPGLNAAEQYLIGFGKFWVDRRQKKVADLFHYGRPMPALHRLLIHVVNKKCLVDYEAVFTNSPDQQPDEPVSPEQQENYNKALNLVMAAFNYHCPKKKYVLPAFEVPESVFQVSEEPKQKKPRKKTESNLELKQTELKETPTDSIDTMALIKKVMEQPFPNFPNKDLGWPAGKKIEKADPLYDLLYTKGPANTLRSALESRYLYGLSPDLKAKNQDQTELEDKDLEKIRKHVVAMYEEKRIKYMSTRTPLIQKFEHILYLVNPVCRHIIQTVTNYLKRKNSNKTFIHDNNIPDVFMWELVNIFHPEKKPSRSNKMSIKFRLGKWTKENPLFQDAKRFMINFYNAKLAFKIHPIKDSSLELQSSAIAMDQAASSDESQNRNVSQDAVGMDTSNSNSNSSNSRLPVQPDGSSIPPDLYAESPSFLMFSSANQGMLSPAPLAFPMLPSAGLTIPGVDDDSDLIFLKQP